MLLFFLSITFVTSSAMENDQNDWKAKWKKKWESKSTKKRKFTSSDDVQSPENQIVPEIQSQTQKNQSEDFIDQNQVIKNEESSPAKKAKVEVTFEHNEGCDKNLDETFKKLLTCVACCKEYLDQGEGNQILEEGRVAKDWLLLEACLAVGKEKKDVNFKVIELLCSYGAKLGTDDLRRAGWNVKAMRLILECGANPNEKLSKGLPIHFRFSMCAPHVNNVSELIDFSLDSGVELNLLDHKGNTVLHYALQYVNQKHEGNRKGLCKLIDMCDKWDPKLNERFAANKNKHFEIIHCFKKKFNKNIDCVEPINELLSPYNYDDRKESYHSSTLSECNHASFRSLLGLASYNGDISTIAEVLNQNTEDINKTSCYYIQETGACAKGSWSYDFTPLQMVLVTNKIAKEDKLKFLQLLVTHGACVTQLTDKMSPTPLMLAALYGNYDCMKFLLDNGALIDERDAKGFTPLKCALMSGNIDCVLLLLEAAQNFTYLKCWLKNQKNRIWRDYGQEIILQKRTKEVEEKITNRFISFAICCNKRKFPEWNLGKLPKFLLEFIAFNSEIALLDKIIEDCGGRDQMLELAPSKEMQKFLNSYFRDLDR